jgi:hypothetical protein
MVVQRSSDTIDIIAAAIKATRQGRIRNERSDPLASSDRIFATRREEDFEPAGNHHGPNHLD